MATHLVLLFVLIWQKQQQLLRTFPTRRSTVYSTRSDWIRQSEDEYRTILTPFLNPREQYILTTLVNRADDLTSHFDGGVSGAESQRAIIVPAVMRLIRQRLN